MPVKLKYGFQPQAALQSILFSFSTSCNSCTDPYLLFQWIEFLLFACLLLGVCIIFSIMACFYKYVDPDQLDKIYLADSAIEDYDEVNMKKKDIQLQEEGNSTKL